MIGAGATLLIPGLRLLGGAGILQRQIKREGAALADRAAELDFTAQEARELAADGETEAGAADLAAGRGVGLLERFEDDLLLLGRDADAGIGDFEGDHGRGAAQGRVIRRPTGRRLGD